MSRWTTARWLAVLLIVGFFLVDRPLLGQDQSTLVIVFNDGHQQNIPMPGSRVEFKGSQMIVTRGGHPQTFMVSHVARIELNYPGAASFNRGHFLGKWKLGDGVGGYFYITLKRDGTAYRSANSSHMMRISGPSYGHWTVVEGEARISWDDGWRDELRKVGDKYEKLAFKPGQTFSDTPDNTADAQNADSEPL